MNYYKITINATPESLEDTAARLTGLGYDCLQIEDERDVEAQSPHWDMTDEALLEHYKGACRVILYMPEMPGAAEDVAMLSSLFDSVESELCREEDWAENWKQYYQPFLVGERLAVHPLWIPAEDYGGRAVYLSNPGMSFGTGLHVSTRLCLEALERRDLSGKRVLDIGCGSGILGLCSLLMGAESLRGVDIDPLAAEVALETAQTNGVADQCRFSAGNFLTDEALRKELGQGYDIICTNIVADVILAIAPYIPGLLAPGGVWVTAGIIDTRADEVAAAQAALGGTLTRTARDGWEGMVLEV